MLIEAKKMGIIFYGKSTFEMAPSFDMEISFEKLNFSPLLVDNYLSEGINFLDLDICNKIGIKLSPLQLRFRIDVYTYFLRCLDLNINFVDSMDKHF
jgi:hypothetical protein